MRVVLTKITFFVYLVILSSLPVVKAQVVKTGICIAYDGNTMIYTGEVSGNHRFYEASKNATWNWNEGVVLESLNRYIDSGAVVKDPFLSCDGQTLYFSMKSPDITAGYDIYYSEFINNQWNKPKALTAVVNTVDDEESPSVTADNRYLYFTRKTIPTKQLSDEEYCRTVYRSHKDIQGNWQEPERVNISLNGCEAYPLIFPDGKTLIFSSSKLPQKRKQKFDLYYVKQTAPGVWSMPIPVDSLNTEMNEISGAVDFHTQKLYTLHFEQNKKETKSSFSSINLPSQIEVTTFVTFINDIIELNTNKPISAELTLKDPITLDILSTTQSDEQGNIKVMLAGGRSYRVDYDAPGYSKYSRIYNFTNTTYRHIEKLTLKKLFQHVNIRLNVYDKSTFIPLNAAVTAIDADNGGANVQAISQKVLGEFILNLPVGKKYQITAKHNGYIDGNILFDLSGTISYDEFSEDIALVADRKTYIFKVVDNQDKLLDARFEIMNAAANEAINASQLAKGVYTAALRVNNDYDITVLQKGYSFDNRIVKSGSLNPADTISVKMHNLEEQTTIALSTVAFADNSAELTSESGNELNRLVELLLENPEMTIEIGAYADIKTDDAFLNRLTSSQARNVADYLVQRGGVTRDRITAKGYGKTLPNNLLYTGSTNNKTTNSIVWFTVVKPALLPELERSTTESKQNEN